MQDFLKMLGGERQKKATKKFDQLRRTSTFESRCLKDVDSMIAEMRTAIAVDNKNALGKKALININLNRRGALGGRRDTQAPGSQNKRRGNLALGN